MGPLGAGGDPPMQTEVSHIYLALGGVHVPSGPACSPVGIFPLRAGSSVWLVDPDPG